MISDFPALQVFLPLFAAPLCVILSRFGRFAWILAMPVTWAVAMMSLMTFGHVYSTGETIHYAMGGWAAPVGIEYRIDLLAASMLVLVSVVGAAVLTFAFKSVNEEIFSERQPYFYAAYLLCLSGLLGIISTNDAFNLYVFLEISSLSSYLLIALGRDRRALSSAFHYLILGTIGATFILIGVGFLYVMTGTLNITDIGNRIADISDTAPVMAAFGFLLVGLSMKAALFPLHMWLPNAYTFAPSAISAFLAAVATKVAIYAMIRFLFSLFGFEYAFGSMDLSVILSALAATAIIVGSLVAVFEYNIKRMLAFSSVAQIGYIILGIGLATEMGVTAGIAHIFNHAAMKGTLFLCLGCMAYRLHAGRVTLDDIRGLGHHMPFTSAAFLVAGLGIMGVPLTAGFISKWYLLSATIENGWWAVSAVIIFSSLLAIIYIWRVIEALYFGTTAQEHDRLVEAHASMVIPACCMAALVVWLGIDTEWNIGVATAITQTLMGDTP